MTDGPLWFLGFDALFEGVFAIVTCVVAVLGIRAWRFFRDPRYLAHAIGFALLSVGYLFLGAENMLLALQQGKFLALVDLLRLVGMVNFLQTMYSLFMLGGVVVLVFVYLQIHDRIVQTLLALLVIFSIAYSPHTKYLFHILLSLLLLAIMLRLGTLMRKNPKTTPIFVGFLCIFVGEVFLIVLAIHPLMYVVAHLVALAGYACVGWSLVRR